MAILRSAMPAICIEVNVLYSLGVNGELVAVPIQISLKLGYHPAAEKV